MNWGDLPSFVAACRALDVEPPAAAVRGLELVQIAEAHQDDPRPRILDLNDNDARDYVTALAVRRHNGNNVFEVGMNVGVTEMTRLLAAEVREACLPDLDRITEELRLEFDTHARPFILAAQEFGFTLATTSDEVILRADEAASAAWRDLRIAWHGIRPVAALRIQMSRVFDTAPTKHSDQWTPQFGPLDYSVCFAAGDNWSSDGAKYVEHDMLGDIDWLALAVEGLRLNSPGEVAAMQEQR